MMCIIVILFDGRIGKEFGEALLVCCISAYSSYSSLTSRVQLPDECAELRETSKDKLLWVNTIAAYGLALCLVLIVVGVVFTQKTKLAMIYSPEQGKTWEREKSNSKLSLVQTAAV
ncbi:DgyrCDS4052 [Dimorphilus gyrociliatus]|uniref:DgyrCDS4052 n=1 Tax=Dimorphilus gyrociliatus TaxID=2664684 RepID=A0A7I8VID5_9ANNE|nr:DgyrCDS4052 [Dimorphilus gyrociliatus]